MKPEEIEKAMSDVAELAIRVADHCARTDIEIYARATTDGKGNPVFEVGESSLFLDGSEDWQTIVNNAVRYIELCASLNKDALPFTMMHVDGLVWFSERS